MCCDSSVCKFRVFLSLFPSFTAQWNPAQKSFSLAVYMPKPSTFYQVSTSKLANLNLLQKSFNFHKKYFILFNYFCQIKSPLRKKTPCFSKPVERKVINCAFCWDITILNSNSEDKTLVYTSSKSQASHFYYHKFLYCSWNSSEISNSPFQTFYKKLYLGNISASNSQILRSKKSSFLLSCYSKSSFYKEISRISFA